MKQGRWLSFLVPLQGEGARWGLWGGLPAFNHFYLHDHSVYKIIVN